MRLNFQKGKQKELLVFIKNKFSFSERGLAKKLKVKRSTLKGWIDEKYTLPASVFNKLIELNPNIEVFKKFIKERKNDNWGSKRGGFKRSKQKSFKKMLMKNREDIDKRRVKERKNINLPKNPYISHISSNSINLKFLLSVLLLTDGTVYFKENRIVYGTKDKFLRDVAFYLLSQLGKYTPRIYLDQNKLFHVCLSDKVLVKELKELTPTFKTYPSSNQTVEEFLKQEQPTLKFLDHADEKTLKECIRAAFSADGSITLDGHLVLSCTHEQLSVEWKKFLNKCNLNVKIWKNKYSWSNIVGVGLCNKEGLKRFQKMGGFIPRVKVSKKSKYFKGWEKNEVLKYVINNRNKIPKSRAGPKGRVNLNPDA